MYARFIFILATCHWPCATVNYTYDVSGRLIKADYGSPARWSYTYDPAAIEQFDSGDPILFKKDLHDLGLLDEEIRRLLDKAAHHVPIAGFVFLGARRQTAGPATRIE